MFFLRFRLFRLVTKESHDVRVSKVLKKVLGLGDDVVIVGWELSDDEAEGARPKLSVRLRRRAARRGPCGHCGTRSPWYDRGDGERRWRHLDVGFATCELVADARRVDCPEHGVTVVALPWARHDSSFTAAFEAWLEQNVGARRSAILGSAGV